MPAPIETWAEAAVTVPAARRSRAKSALRVVFISHLVDCIPRGVGLPRSVVSARGHSFIGQEPCQGVAGGGGGGGAPGGDGGGAGGDGGFSTSLPSGASYPPKPHPRSLSTSWRGRARRSTLFEFGKVAQIRSPSPRSGEGARG